MNTKPGLGETYVKVERHCPRCHAHRYHFAHRDKMPVKGGTKSVVKIVCAECGHDWRGRFLRDEWNNEGE